MYRVVFFIFIIAIALSFCDFCIAQEEMATVVKVIEGEVYCFDYPKSMAAVLKEGKTVVGSYQYKVDDSTAKVKIKRKTVVCYLPEEFRYQIRDQLQPQAKVLLLRKKRKKTNWDLVSVGKIVAGGNTYLKGQVGDMSSAEVDEYEGIADLMQETIKTDEQTVIDEVEGDGEDQDQEPEPDEDQDDAPIDDEDDAEPPEPDPDIDEDEPNEPPDEDDTPDPQPAPPPEPEPEPQPGPQPAPTVYYVDPVNGNDSNHGDAPADAWQTVSYAVEQVGTRGLSNVDINLLAGEYKHVTQDFPMTFTGASSIRFIGQGTGSTIFNGDDDGDGTGDHHFFEIENSTNIVFVDIAFTFAGQNDEGAIQFTNTTGGLSGCQISNCIATGTGLTAGIKVSESSTMGIVDSVISNCTADVAPAVFVRNDSTLTDSFSFNGTPYTNTQTTISNNTVTSLEPDAARSAVVVTPDGGAACTLDLQQGEYIFDSNYSAVNSAAIYCGEQGTVAIAGATFSNNSGRGAVLFWQTTSGVIERCIFDSNQSDSGAGAIYEEECSIDIVNCLFYENSADGPGNAIQLLAGASPNIYNCTFVNTTATAELLAVGSNYTSDIKNCIFYTNSETTISFDATASPTVEDCCFFTTDPLSDLFLRFGTGNGNLAELIAWGFDASGTCIRDDPEFKDISADNYRIDNGISPCVDTGADLASQGVTEDIEGTTRPQGAGFDMGCYESVASDPPITGRIYDSITGELVTSPVVAIYKKYSNSATAVTSDNPYTFNVLPGTYRIAVSKTGYGFPSEVVSAVTSGDHGEFFEAEEEALTIDIPVDSGGWLVIEKQASKKRALKGEIVTYHIKIENKNWYQAVANVELVDEIVNGFKYIKDSTYRSSAQMIDSKIDIVDRKAIFDIGSIAARGTVNISYQVRVGTGITKGKYKATAHARRASDRERNSNYDSAELEVIEDPLFTKGTIIGKVFLDLNGNGLQDTEPIPEVGIPGVKVYTEYGVCIETDDDGKYHIADVPDGRHLLKVDPSTLPTIPSTHDAKKLAKSPEYLGRLDTNYEFTTENPYFVKITEGLLAKVNFGLQPEAADSVERIADSKSTDVGDESSGIKNLLSKFFIVGLGEGTVTNLNTSGNIKMADKDDRYDDGVRVDGRLAFYLKGKVLGKYLVTACVDTERLPGGRYRTKDLFTNLDPDKYYPVYGDASLVDYSGVDTQDVAYVLIEWDESYAKWGSFRTEFPYNLYERTLSGGLVDYVSVGKTKFGDPWTEVKGFGAVSRQKPAHDEFVGTGGSLYYLRHQDLIEGSEQLRVEVRDRISKTAISSISLREELDYEIDYDAGRIILKKPLNSVQQTYSGSIVSNDLLMGERAYLIVDYEYLSTGLSDNAWGLRASQQIGHHVRVGGSYVQEQKAGPNYELASGDATIKLNKDTVISGFYAHSKESQLGSGTSYDGGLTFSSQSDTFSDGKSGQGYNVNARTKLFKNTDIFLSHSKYDPYFSVAGSIAQQGTEKYIANVYSRLTNCLAVGLSHVTSKILKETIASRQLGARDTHVTSGTVDYRKGKWDLRAEYQHQTVKDPVTDYTYFGMLPLRNNDFIAARIGYQLFKWLHPYARGQATVRGEANNQGTVGADIHIWDKTWLHIAETVGNLGDSTLVGLTSQVRGDTDVYANIEVGNNLRLGKFARTTYGQSTSLSKGSRAYVEEDYSSYRENIVRGTLLGYEEQINETLALGLSYERSNVERDDRPEVINRDAGSIALTYLNPDEFWFNTRGIKGYTKLELRNDSGTNNVRQWVTENDILWRLTEGLSVSGRGNWGWTENRSRDTDEAKFYELGTGFSYRPVFWDRLNLLGKYSYLTDLPPDSQWDFPEDIESKRNVYSLEGIFDLFKWVQLVGKVAYRDMKEKVGYRDWTESDTYLYLGRLNFHITEQWDIAAEYRTLRNKQIEDNKSGWLLEVDRELGRYVRLGVGYNFTDYDDDLRNADNYEAKGFFVRVNGKY